MPKCPSCEDVLDTETGVKIHHYNKHGESIAVEESNCERCGELFEYYPSEKVGLFCTNCVDNTWGNDNLVHASGEDNPRWKGGDIDTNCTFCGKGISVQRWHHKEYQNNFCSNKCQNRWTSEKYTGSGNPRYIDGKHRERNYGTGWNSAREKALKRDEYVCIICGKGKEELGRNPAVHHKKPVRTFENPKDAHYLENLVTLCPKHHQEVESGNREIEV